MKADYTVTVWHFEENENVPKRKIFKNVAVDRKMCISKNGIKQKGFFKNDSCSIRIFTKDDVGILPGDYICVGEFSDVNPVVEICHKAVEIRDNRRGTRQHWHVICGG